MTTPTPAPLAATDLATETGWITAPAISPADAITLAALADWGIWPDDHAPDPGEPLGEQFARQIGAGEAVEYFETFELIRAIAHAAYANGYARGTAASARIASTVSRTRCGTAWSIG